MNDDDDIASEDVDDSDVSFGASSIGAAMAAFEGEATFARDCFGVASTIAQALGDGLSRALDRDGTNSIQIGAILIETMINICAVCLALGACVRAVRDAVAALVRAAATNAVTTTTTTTTSAVALPAAGFTKLNAPVRLIFCLLFFCLNSSLLLLAASKVYI